MSQPSEPYQSALPEIKMPSAWQSSIPPYLLDGVDPQTKWLMEEMSKNSQATQFACEGVVLTNGHLRALNGKTYKNEKGLQDLKDQMLTLQSEVLTLKTQMSKVTPWAESISTAKSILSHKLVWVILGLAALFLLGYNRDVLPTIWKAVSG